MSTKPTHYYEVAVDDRGIKQLNTLTYHYNKSIPLGSVVRVALRNKEVNGVVIKTPTETIEYKTKPIKAILYSDAISKPLLKTAHWMQEYYAASLGEVINLLLPRGAHKQRRGQTTPTETSVAKKTPPTLSTAQRKALTQLEIAKNNTALLHGITGSGKTRLYIERAKHTLENGRSVIILVPEIGLTSQMVQEVQKQFSKVFLLHSNQTESARHQEWESIYKAGPSVVIGPRSALFSPLKKLGLIIVDEEHEASYKQDANPKYHTVHTAAYLAKTAKAQLILGSATPRIEDYYLAVNRRAPIIRMASRVYKHAVSVQTVDLKSPEGKPRDSAFFSQALIHGMEQSLRDKKQIMLFHNRRGNSTSVVCSNCGWVGECRICQMPLTHHADWRQLLCHICNYRQPVAISCPECKTANLHYKGFGTKQIVDELKARFPTATIRRYDSDTPKAERLEKNYNELRNGNVQIIVGTQMVAKGLDLPLLQTVGVLLADTALYLPDYNANERTFQLLYQIIGRVGRHQAGNVIVQTYSPKHPAIVHAVNEDYAAFYDREIAERELHKYPPFSFLLQLTCTYATRERAVSVADALVAKLRNEHTRGIVILGPSPAFHERTRQGYRWQIVIKSAQRKTLLQIIANLPQRWQFDIDPINLL